MTFWDLLILFDRALFELVYSGLRPEAPAAFPVVDRLMMVVNVLGEYLVLVPLALGLWWAARDKAQFAAWALFLAVGLGLSSAAMGVLKHTADRSRPATVFVEPAPPPEEHDVRNWRMERPEEATLQPWFRDFVNVPFNVDEPHRRLFYRYSFPSAHAQLAFGIAAALAAWFAFLRVPIFVCAMLTALSRVYGGHHFPFDVLAGALLGWGAMMLTFWTAQRLVARARQRYRRDDTKEAAAPTEPAAPRWATWLARGLPEPPSNVKRSQRNRRRIALLALIVAYPLTVVALAAAHASVPTLIATAAAALVAPVCAVVYLAAVRRQAIEETRS